MEHISKNTQSDRIVHLIKIIKEQNQEVLEKKIDKLIDTLSGICSGIISAILAEGCFSYFRVEEIYINLLFFAVLFLFLWFLIWKIFYFIKKRNEDLFLMKKPQYEEILDTFNYDIVQKISEINEETEIALNTKNQECQLLNFIVAFNKWKQVVYFMSDNFSKKKWEFRGDGTTILVESQDKYFNQYVISAVILVMESINKKFENLIELSPLKEEDGYRLLVSDFTKLNDLFENFKMEFCADIKDFS